MKRYWAFLVIILVFSSIHSPMATAQTDRPLSDYPIITAPNISQLKQLKVLGEGYIRDVIFSPDEQFVAMATSVGIWLYSADDLETPIRLFGDYAIDVTYAMFSADGTRLYGGIQGGSVYIWDVASGELVTMLEDTNDEYLKNSVEDIQLSDDEQLLYVMTEGYLTIWDLQNRILNKLVQLYEPYNLNVYSQEEKNYNRLSPDKKHLLKFEIYWVEIEEGDYLETKTTIIDVETEESYIIQSDGLVYSPHFDDTGEKIIAELTHHAVGVWDVYSGELLFYVGELGYGYKGNIYTKPTHYHYDIHEPYPKVGIITKDQTKLILLGGAIWDIATNTMLHQFTTTPSARFDENDDFIPHENITITYTTNEDELMSLLEEENVIEQIPIYFRLAEDRGIYDSIEGFLDISPQYQHLLFVGANTIRIWNTQTGKLSLINFAESCSVNTNAHLSLNDTRVVSYTFDDEDYLGYVCVWHTENQELLYTVPHRLIPYTSGVLDNQHFISGDYTNQIPIKIWDLATNTFIEPFPNITYIYTFTFSPTGQYLVLAAGAMSNKVKILDTQTGSIIQEIQHERTFHYAFFSPDESKLALVFGPGLPREEYKSEVYVWDIENWSFMYQIEVEEGIAKIAFSPDGQYLLTMENNIIQSWNTESGDLIYTLSKDQFNADSNIYNPFVTFNHDGSQFAVQSSWRVDNQGQLSIRDTLSGNEITTLSLNIAPIIEGKRVYSESIDFSPINNLLMMAFNNGIIQFWDTNTGEIIHTMPTASFYGGKFTFNDKGNLILAEMGDGTIRIWGIGE